MTDKLQTHASDNPDVRELRKWLNEGQTGEIDRNALARVLAMFVQPEQPDILAQWDEVQGEREGCGRQWHSVGAWLRPGDAIAVISDSRPEKVPAQAASAQKPVANCTIEPLQMDEYKRRHSVKWVGKPVAGPLYTAPSIELVQQLVDALYRVSVSCGSNDPAAHEITTKAVHIGRMWLEANKTT